MICSTDLGVLDVILVSTYTGRGGVGGGNAEFHGAVGLTTAPVNAVAYGVPDDASGKGSSALRLRAMTRTPETIKYHKFV